MLMTAKYEFLIFFTAFPERKNLKTLFKTGNLTLKIISQSIISYIKETI